MTKHTPGPWRFDECDDYRDGGEVVAEPPYQTIRICEIPLWLAAPEEMRANAALIAAAPDLLDFAHNVGGMDDGLLASADLNLYRATLREFIGQARAAIAKAEGRSCG